MPPILEFITQSLNHGDLPETWHVPDIDRFSQQKTLYDYQTDALQKATRALFLYYGSENNDYQVTEPQDTNHRKHRKNQPVKNDNRRTTAFYQYN